MPWIEHVFAVIPGMHLRNGFCCARCLFACRYPMDCREQLHPKCRFKALDDLGNPVEPLLGCIVRCEKCFGLLSSIGVQL